jgi:YgiT-type zinc finger domain-containing protein
MIGERAKINRCPLCGGRLTHGLAAVPFLLRDAVVLIKDVPAEICANCHEPFTSGKASDGVIGLLNPLRDLRAEVLVLSYTQLQSVSTADPLIAA